MSSGPGIWDFRTRFNIETVGAQSQASVRERAVRIKYYPNCFAKLSEA